jgi:hypothetical protein
MTRDAAPSHVCHEADRLGAFFRSPSEVTYEVCVEFPTGRSICKGSQYAAAGTLYVNEITATGVTGNFGVTWLIEGQQVGSWSFRIPARQPIAVFGHTAILRPLSGTVLFKRPGSPRFTRLSSTSRIPLGTLIDTSSGSVRLTSAVGPHGGAQTGQFDSGVFRVSQRRSRSRLDGRVSGLTVLSLVGGLPRGCGRFRAEDAKASSRPRGRRLWGNAHGNFQTGGRYASATVTGTKWLTEDTCAGTLIKVARGVVRVKDFARHRTVLVRAPQSYLAHSGAGE